MLEKDETGKINLLDHGFIRLVDHMGSDLSVVRSARTSYDAEWRTGEDGGKDEKLINYLIKNKHTSPLESVTFTFDVKAPIFVFRQWHRHRTQSISEVSGRYAELPEEFYVPDPEQITTQSSTNKQMRTDQVHKHADHFANVMRAANANSFRTYKQMIEDGVPRELARTVLPLATYSHMFTTMNLLNLLKFIGLRSHSHAQYEIRVYADAMLESIEPIVPMIVKAYREHGL